MKVAYPDLLRQEGRSTAAGVNRREELAKLMIEGRSPPIADARWSTGMWGHFFGYGFTKPSTTWGRTTRRRIRSCSTGWPTSSSQSGFDMKQLMRWIALSEAYQLSSQHSAKNENDDPAVGETPLFSHFYLQQMQPSSLYDSLIVATEADKSGRSSWEEAEQQRQQWLQQFIDRLRQRRGRRGDDVQRHDPAGADDDERRPGQNARAAEPGSFLDNGLPTTES